MPPRAALIAFISALTVVVAIYFTPVSTTTSTILSQTRPLISELSSIRSTIAARLSRFHSPSTISTTSTTSSSSLAASTLPNMTFPKGDVYFLSHGGPPTMFATGTGPYEAWKRYGKMVEAANPRGLVVVSAHWENPDESDTILINEDTTNPMVYDFYGFPDKYYKQVFKSRGSPEMVSEIKTALSGSGMSVKTEKRGLDHGVWVPFIVAFEDQKTSIPIVQVSLPGDSSPVSCAKLGRALASLRAQGYGIMGTGQVVHNLRDFRFGSTTSYGPIFMSAVTSALQSSQQPLENVIQLFRHPMYRQAHPTPEHFFPLVVAAAAVEKGDKLEEIYAESDGALGWGMWRWTAPAASA